MRWNTAPSFLLRLHSLSYVAALCSASENVLLAIFCYRSDAAVWMNIAAVLLPVAGLNDNSLDRVAAYNVEVDRQRLLGLVRRRLLGAIEIAEIKSMRGCFCAIDVKQASANALQKTHVVPFEPTSFAS